MDYKDYYKTLGVERDAAQNDINKAYRRLARKYHPDISKEPSAEERFKEVGEAYEVLKDPEKRAAYDQLGSEWQTGEAFRPPRPTGMPVMSTAAAIIERMPLHSATFSKPCLAVPAVGQVPRGRRRSFTPVAKTVTRES